MTDLHDLGNAAAVAADALAAIAEAAIDSDDLEVVAGALAALDTIAERLVGSKGSNGYRDEVETHLLAVMDGHAETKVDIDGMRFTRKATRKRKAWKWDELFTHLTPAIRHKPRLLHDDGEVEDDTARAVRILRDCLSLSAGKVTGLRDIGLDPDEFCEAGPLVYTIERQPL